MSRFTKWGSLFLGSSIMAVTTGSCIATDWIKPVIDQFLGSA